MYATDVASAGVAYLYSPVFAVVSTNAQLTFWQDYILEAHGTRYYDGGVLDIAIGSGSFTDIISSGGSFVSNGYNGTLSSSYSNPLGGRKAWSGSSSGWITTIITLPAAAAGQNVQLCWECATDTGNTYSAVGWAIDAISLKDTYYSCCADSASLSVIETATPSPFTLGQNGTYTITVTNAGPDLAADVVVTDTLPSEVTFVSASTGGVYDNGVIVWPIGTILSNGSSTMTVTVLAEASGVITNTAVATSVTPASLSGTNTAINVTTINLPPTIVIGGVAVTASGISISVNSALGLNYSLEYKNSLTDPAWTLLPSSTVTGTGGAIILLDTSPLQTQRFYVVIAN